MGLFVNCFYSLRLRTILLSLLVTRLNFPALGVDIAKIFVVVVLLTFGLFSLDFYIRGSFLSCEGVVMGEVKYVGTLRAPTWCSFDLNQSTSHPRW